MKGGPCRNFDCVWVFILLSHLRFRASGYSSDTTRRLLSTGGPFSLSISHIPRPFCSGRWGLFENPPELEGPNFRRAHAYTVAVYVPFYPNTGFVTKQMLLYENCLVSFNRCGSQGGTRSVYS
ncbi:hypothetical protein M441DRAFT_350825 [Trichoderma asperellum CBS 433.97]|uniref:Secreted protein n=1 Tax=Trichoderma asperellum (strain ATCC 204424 / CBS 433.97 / NBRC 101777) TaxID=1042311 RepID=A0A2T3ZIA6_TRIA4|nr:hypothetical protein M441DRAFT_350825 [Trichoderma asperellum CBS 433.97]PTB44541.1 hypothetical protein M441DRAFT_350825 [Trichoderma asperellum CBS 433.97]